MSDPVNGWPNGATWRVNAELWSNDEPAYRELMASRHDSTYDLAQWLKARTEERIDTDPQIAQWWADAYISGVDWHRLAKSWQEANPELIRSQD